MFVLLDDQVSHRQLYFTQPRAVIEFRIGDDVGAFFAKVDAAQAAGLWLAGQFNYEFGAALEPKLAHIAEPGTIVARLGIFGEPSDHPPVHLLYRAEPPEVSLSPLWSQSDYVSRYETVQRYLEAGDAYQINLTFPMTGRRNSDAAALYAGYRRRQPGRYGAIVSLGGPDVVSFSPELFFAREGRSMRMRPMKGTRPPRNSMEGAADDMRDDEKSRAENLMIVDLLRNDLSRLCEPGSVRVPELFTLEDYPTLTQMTSSVTGELRDDARWEDIFRALFPCGSVTGAPKIRAMEIIHELESKPRGAYCGSVGYIAPDGRASFSVSIRTAEVKAREVRYCVGSGVVLDSDGADEYSECLLKAELLTPKPEAAIETMLWTPENGLQRQDLHFERFYAARPNGSISLAVDRLVGDGPMRVRVSAGRDGVTSIGTTPYQPMAEPLSLAISRYALTPEVQRTDFKSSRRDFYDGERERVRALTGADEVLFLNEDGLLKEGSFTSLFVKRGGVLLTPRGPGLLPGVLRAELLEDGRAVEADLAVDDLAGEFFVGNSLRGLMRAKLNDRAPH